jgi:hypothetical protein
VSEPPADPFEYSDRPVSILHVVVDGVTSRADLFRFLETQLAFPDFGHTWGALKECLGDLAWLSATEVILSHPRLPPLSRADLRLYLEILADAVRERPASSSPRLRVFFTDRIAVAELLAKATLTPGELAVSADFDRALQLRDVGAYQEGIDLLESVVSRLGPADRRLVVMSRIQIAFMHHQRGDHSAAAHHFRRATSLAPESELASLGLFHALIRLVQTRDAMLEMVRFLRLRASSEYHDLMHGDFGDVLEPALASLRDEALELLRRHGASN